MENLSNLTLAGYKEYVRQCLLEELSGFPRKKVEAYYEKSMKDIEWAYKNEYLPCKLPNKSPHTGGFIATLILLFE